MSGRAVITLLTDFGLADPYVGMMKGVIAGANPEALVIDLTHEIPPQDVATAAFVLERSAPFFPPGTVHVAVVDPGVGTARRGIARKARDQIFVGPDNGVLTLAAPKGPAVELMSARHFLPQVSNTFHGRDVFAPAAARLSLGLPLSELGPPAPRVTAMAWPGVHKRGKRTVGQIVSVDRFGNLITNLEPSHWKRAARPTLTAGPFRTDRLSRNYQDVAEGELLVVFGGYGLLEIAQRDGSAAKRLGLGKGDGVVLSDRWATPA